MVGSQTKLSEDILVRAFEIGNKMSMEYLNNFVPQSVRITDFNYKNKININKKL